MLILKYGLLGLVGIAVVSFLMGLLFYRIHAGSPQKFEYTSRQVILSPTPRMAFEMLTMAKTAIWVDGEPHVFYFNGKDAKSISEQCGSFTDAGCKVEFEARPLYFGGFGPASLISVKGIK